MSMTSSLRSINVSEAMNPVKFTVSSIDKIGEVAKLFELYKSHSAPVVDEVGKCVGIVTSSDLVRFQSELSETNANIDLGMSFDLTNNELDGSVEIVSHPFDEVQRHMSTCLQTIEQDSTLFDAAKIMCVQHIHHLIALDKSQRPTGVLSSLDILARLTE